MDVGLAGLAEAIDAIDQGVLWQDGEMVIRGHNLAFLVLLGVGEGEQFVGRQYGDVLGFLFAHGELFDNGDHHAFVEEQLCGLRKREAQRFEWIRPNGKVLRICSTPLRSGGYVHTFVDISNESQAIEDARRNTKAVVLAMANFAEHRDTDTGVHVLRVSRLVGQTARQLQRQRLFPEIIDDAYIEHIGTATMLHDVGKIATPDRILLKPGPLSDEERQVMKLHADAGNLLLKQAGLVMIDNCYLRAGAEIAHTHHEWFNGNGYPNGLAGDGIPLSGRICAVADVFDALTSRRPYKEPWSDERAVMQIRQLAGIQFDPLVVDAFSDVIESRAKVSIVQWTESMSVGNQHIDEQHMILIDTINQLASADSQNDRPVVAIIIDELLSYAAFHFHYEEQLIEAAGYPELESHRRIHRGFVKRANELREEFTYHRKRRLGEHILCFLRDWLREHILGEDRLYCPYILRGDGK